MPGCAVHDENGMRAAGDLASHSAACACMACLLTHDDAIGASRPRAAQNAPCIDDLAALCGMSGTRIVVGQAKLVEKKGNIAALNQHVDGWDPSSTTPPGGRMVGATGIEPVTPTMSIVVDANAEVQLIQISS